MQRPRAESALCCSTCQTAGRPLTGHLTLGIDVVDGTATVRSVDFFCSDACLSESRPRWVREQVELHALADVDPYAHLDVTIPKYAWARGTIERFARMLSAVTRWRTSMTVTDTGALLDPLPGASSSDAPPRRTEN